VIDTQAWTKIFFNKNQRIVESYVMNDFLFENFTALTVTIKSSHFGSHLNNVNLVRFNVLYGFR